MLASIIGLVLIAVALLAFALQRFYSLVPAKEMKRLASRGEQLARVLYRPVAYGPSLRVLLWLVTVICLPIGFLLVAENLPIWASLLVMFIALGVCLVWLPSAELTLVRSKLVVKVTPSLDWVLHYTHPVFNALARLVNDHRQVVTHSLLYEKEDLDALIKQQRLQADNRISEGDLSLVSRALSFNDAKVGNIIAPRSSYKLISSGEALGPVLLDELYKSKQQYYAVFRGQQDNIVGILSMHDLSNKRTSGHVSDVMRTDVCFVGEDFSLPQVAGAFIKTGQLVALVINKFEECVGIVTFKNLVDCLFETDINQSDELNYSDRQAVAVFEPQPVIVTDEPDENEDEPSSEQSEVVE